MNLAAITCGQSACPIANGGSCLEGFPAGLGCPSLITSSEDSATIVGPDATFDEIDATYDAVTGSDLSSSLDASDTITSSEPDRDVWVNLGGDVALTLDEANEVAAEAPCQVILIAGEINSGKTTLVVELYAQFLSGSFANVLFGGSRTLRALDQRHHPARETSGNSKPDTDRTADEDMRLLHLRLRHDGRTHNLLLSDVRGEFFEDLVNGGGVERIPLAPRADICLVVIDGQLVARAIEREMAISRARQLLGGLTESGGLKPDARLAITVTKADLLGDDAQTWVESRLQELCAWVNRRGRLATTITFAARPPTGSQQGLEQLLEFVLGPRPLVQRSVERAEASDRHFWNQPEKSR